ncbi:PHD finger protein 7 isoform X2 [Bubalus kerabau]|uniref:PHD finger protein 7 isoform X2 n=1 Tax=Bubalus bubalis TaxID=89462 RepID=UPI00042D0366|nr:PHD finger protein 7 isoform X2 [Bubalus bubalis]XP_055413610.1 PHD finger protein 7 isoform X2 [Bubalus carabanensis]
MKSIKEKKKEHQRLRKSAKTKRVTQRKRSSGPVCRLCLQEPGDPEKVGEFLQKDNLSVHYFCLILSSKLPQRGQSNRGFHGFLPEDIRKEAARASRKICFVCKRKGAAINCQKDQCVRNFHLPCGLERGCLSQFFGEYKSFCGEHRPTQNIRRRNVGEESCILCCEDLSQISVENIQSPCCSQTIYHRKCIQKYAHTSAKHFFKCPQCNNREEFPQEMLRMGIHIPDRKWRLILCATCGSHGTHRNCSSLRSNCKKWECTECAPAAKVIEYTLENSGDIPCCSSTFLSRGHFYRDTGLEENPGPSWTSWPGSSLLENPESSGPRRSHSWESKGVTISKSCKKSE